MEKCGYMLYRKIERRVREHFESDNGKVLLVSGARQVGKSFIIRHVGSSMFRNFIEINLIADYEGNRLFESVRTVTDFYFILSTVAGDRMGDASDTVVFLDEIQQYPHLLTLLKFLREDNRFRYVASGSLLGVTLRTTTSVPLGSIDIVQMYPLDFEEFLIANGFAPDAISHMRDIFIRNEELPEQLHQRVMDLYRRYLLVGGLPEAVNAFIETHNIVAVRRIQTEIHALYGIDAAKYDSAHRLNIKRIYELVPSNLENKKKRLVFKDIENKNSSRSVDYAEDLEYLVSSGIALEVKAISNPRFPLIESEAKNLLKLYLNDVGLLSNILYRNNVNAVLTDQSSVNLGSLYECAVACQLAANGHRLFYYDNKTYGEVDYLVDDYESLSVVPIEVKSGKDYKRHIALSRFVSTPDYHIHRGYVLSNVNRVECVGSIVYAPVYCSMFFSSEGSGESEIII